MDASYGLTITRNYVNGDESEHTFPPMTDEAMCAAMGMALDDPLVSSCVFTVVKIAPTED